MTVSLGQSDQKAPLPPPRRRGVWVAIIAAAAILVFGLIPLLLNTNSPPTAGSLVPPTFGEATVPSNVTWSRVPNDDSVFGGEGDQQMVSVIAGGPGLVAVGSDGLEGADHRTAIWTSVDGLSWSRITHDPVVFGVDDALRSVTTGGPGLVAVGSAEDHVAAVWTSTDGLTWARVPHDDATFVQGWMSSATSGGPGLVAVGELDPDAAVWTSVDGLTWSRVPHDDAVFGQARMNSVTVGGPGLVAVGSDGSGAAVWTSPDGTSWSRVPHDDAVFGTAGTVSMNSVTAGGPGLVAVGYDGAFGGSRPPVWTSVDGVIWTRVPDDQANFTDLGDSSMESVIAGGPGLVAVGASHLDAIGRGEPPTAASWTSADGISWSRIPYDEEAFGRGQMNMVTVGSSGLVAVGTDGSYWDGDAAVWVSDD